MPPCKARSNEQISSVEIENLVFNLFYITREFFENFHRQRAKKGIKVKMLVNHDAKELLVKTIRSNSEIRFLPQYLMNNMIILFYKNKAFIFFLANDSVGILIENEEATKGFKSYFDAFWKIAKK